MKLIDRDGVKGYLLNDIKKELTKKEYKSFKEFMRGQTVMIVDNDQLVYKWDFDRWKEGLQPFW